MTRTTPASPPEPTVGSTHLAADPLAPAERAFVTAATTARLFLPGPPTAYDTRSWLVLRADHAAARDAVNVDLGVELPLLAGWIARHQPLEVHTAAGSLHEYLRRPDRGRQLAPSSRELLVQADLSARGPADLALVVGDGLSAAAVSAHAPALADALADGAVARGWRVRHPPILVRRCRVGLLNELGPLVGADVIILLIGERPGLGAADSLSAYLAFRPQPGHSDADRNLVSGIHSRGTPILDAATRVLDLAGLLLELETSGVAVKERLGGVELTPRSIDAGGTREPRSDG